MVKLIGKVTSSHLRTITLGFKQYPSWQDRVDLQTLLLDDTTPFGSNTVTLRCIDDAFRDEQVEPRWDIVIDPVKGGFSLLDEQGRLEFMRRSGHNLPFSWDNMQDWAETSYHVYVLSLSYK